MLVCIASSSQLYENDVENLLSILFLLSKLVDMGPEEGEKYLQEVGTQRLEHTDGIL